MNRTSHKTVVLALASIVLALGLCAIDTWASPPAALSSFSSPSCAVSELVTHNPNNQAVTSSAVAMLENKPPKDDKKPSGGKSAGDSNKDSKQAPAASQPSSSWSLVIGTFSEGEHEQAARTMLDQLRLIAPEVARGARVRIGSKGSMVLYGNYTGRDDANAKADQDKLKNLKYQNHPVFNRVILTRVDNRTMTSQFAPNDLLGIRQKNPKVDPLYTVDIAMWDDFGAGKMSYEDIRKKAEAYAAQLRAQNVEAFFYHDDENQRSIVTVGLFDRRAIDTTSGLFSPGVEAIMKKFPARMVNGEPLMEFKDPYHQSEGVKPQTPKLVLVPEL